MVRRFSLKSQLQLRNVIEIRDQCLQKQLESAGTPCADSRPPSLSRSRRTYSFGITAEIDTCMLSTLSCASQHRAWFQMLWLHWPRARLSLVDEDDRCDRTLWPYSVRYSLGSPGRWFRTRGRGFPEIEMPLPRWTLLESPGGVWHHRFRTTRMRSKSMLTGWDWRGGHLATPLQITSLGRLPT